MNWLIVFAVVAVTAATSSHKPHFEAFSDELIRYVNEQVRFLPPISLGDVPHMMLILYYLNVGFVIL